MIDAKYYFITSVTRVEFSVIESFLCLSLFIILAPFENSAVVSLDLEISLFLNLYFNIFFICTLVHLYLVDIVV